MYYKLIMRLAFLLVWTAMMIGCNDDKPDEPFEIKPDEPISASVMERLLQSVSIDWGQSYDVVRASMPDYTIVDTDNSDMLQFRDSKGNYSISYLFNSSELSATAVILPVSNVEIKLDELLESFRYVGELTNVAIYENKGTNTVASVWQYVESDSAYCAIGFAPIRSNLYPELPPITVKTGNAEVNGFTASFSGVLEGVDSDVEVGVLYSTDSNLSEDISCRVSCIGRGEYSVVMKGLIDESTYYYRAYALIDDVYYLGDIRTLTTGKATYSMDGQVFDFVKVDGFTGGNFSIMQTELLYNHDLVIGSDVITRLDRSGDGHVIKTEFRNFIDEIREVTGIPFRLPTPDEWIYAAQGGNKSAGYKYCGGNDIASVAWYSDNSGKSLHPVAMLASNELGLYDMSGNYSELCNSTDDIYYIDDKCYGGSWKSSASDCTPHSYINGIRSGNIPGTRLKEKNAFDGRYITVRLVYSREQ